jgi:hypothetical protein
MLDLNEPRDARRYVFDWVKRGDLRLGTDEVQVRLEEGTDDDFIRVARELFLFCDPLIPPPPLKPAEYH